MNVRASMGYKMKHLGGDDTDQGQPRIGKIAAATASSTKWCRENVNTSTD